MSSHGAPMDQKRWFQEFSAIETTWKSRESGGSFVMAMVYRSVTWYAEWVSFKSGYQWTQSKCKQKDT